MIDYKDMYFHLFNAVTDALEALDAQNFGQARTILVTAQQETEEMYNQGWEEPKPLSEEDIQRGFAFLDWLETATEPEKEAFFRLLDPDFPADFPLPFPMDAGEADPS